MFIHNAVHESRTSVRVRKSLGREWSYSQREKDIWLTLLTKSIQGAAVNSASSSASLMLASVTRPLGTWTLPVNPRG